MKRSGKKSSRFRRINLIALVVIVTLEINLPEMLGFAAYCIKAKSYRDLLQVGINQNFEASSCHWTRILFAP